MLRRNQHQPSRGIETSSVLQRRPKPSTVEININPVEGLKLVHPSGGLQQRGVEININPVEGLKRRPAFDQPGNRQSKSTSTQSRD